jgi:hypothetical protein
LPAASRVGCPFQSVFPPTNAIASALTRSLLPWCRRGAASPGSRRAIAGDSKGNWGRSAQTLFLRRPRESARKRGPRGHQHVARSGSLLPCFRRDDEDRVGLLRRDVLEPRRAGKDHDPARPLRFSPASSPSPFSSRAARRTRCPPAKAPTGARPGGRRLGIRRCRALSPADGRHRSNVRGPVDPCGRGRYQRQVSATGSRQVTWEGARVPFRLAWQLPLPSSKRYRARVGLHPWSGCRRRPILAHKWKSSSAACDPRTTRLSPSRCRPSTRRRSLAPAVPPCPLPQLAGGTILLFYPSPAKDWGFWIAFGILLYAVIVWVYGTLWMTRLFRRAALPVKMSSTDQPITAPQGGQ